MASKFPEEETPCQGTGCTQTSGATYRVEENQALCDKCVSKKAGSIKPKLEWICEEHDEPIKYFCISDNKEACQLCVTISHQDCHFDAAKTVLKEMKERLAKLQSAAPQRVGNFERRRHQFGQIKQEVESHLMSVEKDVSMVIDDELRKEKKNMQARALEIEREAEEEIKKIKAGMVDRLKRNKEDGEAPRNRLEERRSFLLSDVKKHGNCYSAFVDELMSRLIEQSNSLQEKIRHIDLLCEQDDREVLEGSQELVVAASELLQEDDLDEMVNESARQAKTLKFFHAEHKSLAEGKIDGFYGIWNREKTHKLYPENMMIVAGSLNTICGCLNEDEIILQNKSRYDLDDIVYLADLKTGEMAAVEFEKKGTTWIEECVPLSENQVVCCLNPRNVQSEFAGRGKWFISIFDKHSSCSWKLLKDLPCPWAPGYNNCHIDIDKDGNVIAALQSQQKVHVINPKEDTIIHTISWPEENGRVSGRIHALSTGDIAAKIGHNAEQKFCIIDRAGIVKVTIRDDDWIGSVCKFTVDPLTDMLYITYVDRYDCKAVDQLSCDGVFKEKRIVNLSDNGLFVAYIYITPSGRLISTYRQHIIVLKSEPRYAKCVLQLKK